MRIALPAGSALFAPILLVLSADAQIMMPKSGLQPMRSAVDLIKKQAPLQVNQTLLTRISPDDLHVLVSLSQQRAFLMMGNEMVVNSPISSGKRPRFADRQFYGVGKRSEPSFHVVWRFC